VIEWFIDTNRTKGAETTRRRLPSMIDAPKGWWLGPDPLRHVPDPAHGCRLGLLAGGAMAMAMAMSFW